MEDKQPLVFIAISHSEVDPWIKIKIDQEQTWIKSLSDDAEVIFYLSQHPPFFVKKFDFYIEKYRYSKRLGRLVSIFNKLSGEFVSHKIPEYNMHENSKSLIVNSWSTYQLFGRRNLALFDWFLKNTNARYLYQTNISSYINTNKLIENLNSFNEKDLVYAGSIINADRSPFPIVSGSGKLLSRNLIVEIIKNSKQLKFNNVEDVALAELVHKIGVEAVDLPRLDLPNLSTLQNCSDFDLDSNFQFRCKSDSTPRNDGQIMKELHRRLYDKTNKSDRYS
jgi:hypothetical protein